MNTLQKTAGANSVALAIVLGCRFMRSLTTLP